jgi:hypothetical protein
MSLDINEARQVFSEYLRDNYHKSKSLDAGLMAAVEFAYRKGFDDGNAERLVRISRQLTTPGEAAVRAAEST